jgi:hypothetical protein
MVPSILPGDLVLIQRASLHEISPGEVVLFLQKGRLFVHRVVDRKIVATAGQLEESCLITRGDRLRHEDPPVTEPELLGRLIVRLLQSSDRVTYFYLRLAAAWRSLFLRRAKCQA